MSNILNHNRLPFEVSVSKSDYWDFHLHIGIHGGGCLGGLQERCLVSFIDTNISDCLSDYGLVSLPYFYYKDGNSKGVSFNNIGLTGMDNGLIIFDKHTITLEEFSDMLTKSVYTIEEDDYTLKLRRVDGNNGIYDYTEKTINLDGVTCARLNGGFYQGIYATKNGCDYKVLPNNLGNGWSLEFELRRCDFENPRRTLNSVYPENKGIFFYMGTRAENKWVKNYTIDIELNRTDYDTYVPVRYVSANKCNTSDEQYSTWDYFVDEYTNENDCKCGCREYFTEKYMEEAVESETDAKIDTTNDGHSLDNANEVEIESDNKFLLFDRSCNGVTVKTYEDDMKAVINYINLTNDLNYFMLFNRTCDGMTADKFGDYVSEKSKEYDILGDLYRNALAFQIKDDGSIGYRYFVKDCDNEDGYKVETETSYENIVPYDEWVTVHVRILPMHGGKTMRMLFYVNGKLVLYSKEMEKFDFRELNDLSDKQECVPFNISLGGGTQGLCDVIYSDFMKLPEYIYPLEREFGGSFIGYLKSFKFYECSLNYNEIVKNYLYNKANILNTIENKKETVEENTENTYFTSGYLI